MASGLGPESKEQMLWTRPQVVLWGGSALLLPDFDLDTEPQKWDKR